MQQIAPFGWYILNFLLAWGGTSPSEKPNEQEVHFGHSTDLGPFSAFSFLWSRKFYYKYVSKLFINIMLELDEFYSEHYGLPYFPRLQQLHISFFNLASHSSWPPDVHLLVFFLISSFGCPGSSIVFDFLSFIHYLSKKIARNISHIKPSKYDSTFGIKISIIMFEKSMGDEPSCGSEQAPYSRRLVQAW